MLWTPVPLPLRENTDKVCFQFSMGEDFGESFGLYFPHVALAHAPLTVTTLTAATQEFYAEGEGSMPLQATPTDGAEAT